MKEIRLVNLSLKDILGLHHSDVYDADRNIKGYKMRDVYISSRLRLRQIENELLTGGILEEYYLVEGSRGNKKKIVISKDTFYKEFYSNSIEEDRVVKKKFMFKVEIDGYIGVAEKIIYKIDGKRHSTYSVEFEVDDDEAGKLLELLKRKFDIHNIFEGHMREYIKDKRYVL